mmetsp:Transcript_1811/g.2618  ORF Transcript_1811/g.2618 Transcript_1811/m.2618 type:complete len:109 (+) Transcript_1811:644-970(+)
MPMTRYSSSLFAPNDGHQEQCSACIAMKRNLHIVASATRNFPSIQQSQRAESVSPNGTFTSTTMTILSQGHAQNARNLRKTSLRRGLHDALVNIMGMTLLSEKFPASS